MDVPEVEWLIKKLEDNFSMEDFDKLNQMCQSPGFLEVLQFIAEQRGSNP